MLAIVKKTSETRQRQRATKARLRRDEYGAGSGNSADRAFPSAELQADGLRLQTIRSMHNGDADTGASVVDLLGPNLAGSAWLRTSARSLDEGELVGDLVKHGYLERRTGSGGRGVWFAPSVPQLRGALELLKLGTDIELSAWSAELMRRRFRELCEEFAELVFVGGDQRATGLFGTSDVWVTEVASTQARQLLVEEQQPPACTLPPAGTTRPAELTLERRALPCDVPVLPPEVRARVSPPPSWSPRPYGPSPPATSSPPRLARTTWRCAETSVSPWPSRSGPAWLSTCA